MRLSSNRPRCTRFGGMGPRIDGWIVCGHGSDHRLQHEKPYPSSQTHSGRGTSPREKFRQHRGSTELTIDTWHIAGSSYSAWILHLQQPPCLRMVPLCHCNWLEDLLDTSQCLCLDEEQTLLFPQSASGIYHYGPSSPAVLGIGYICHFRYFNNINHVFKTARPLEPLFRYDFLFIVTS